MQPWAMVDPVDGYALGIPRVHILGPMRANSDGISHNDQSFQSLRNLQLNNCPRHHSQNIQSTLLQRSARS